MHSVYDCAERPVGMSNSTSLRRLAETGPLCPGVIRPAVGVYTAARNSFKARGMRRRQHRQVAGHGDPLAGANLASVEAFDVTHKAWSVPGVLYRKRCPGYDVVFGCEKDHAPHHRLDGL